MSAASVSMLLVCLVSSADVAIPLHASPSKISRSQLQLDSLGAFVLHPLWGSAVPQASQVQPAWQLAAPETPVLPEGRGRSCSGAEHRMLWNAQWSSLQWLRIRLGLINSLEPQRCTVAARICFTDC